MSKTIYIKYTMNKLVSFRILILAFSLSTFSCSQEEKQSMDSRQNDIPHLVKQGETTQLIVDNIPFIILGGELGNSSFTSMEYMNPIWPKLKVMNLNLKKSGKTMDLK
jgi:hypothetical protein